MEEAVRETKKKTKVLIATNLYQIDPVCYAGHLKMFYQLGKAFDEFEIVFHGPWRMPIDVARNSAAKTAMRLECDYLLFYDDDMYFSTGQDIVKLLRTIRDSNDTIHVLQALAYVRGYPFKPMCFKKAEIEEQQRTGFFDDYKDYVDENGLVKCDAVGCCATAIDVNLFKLTPEPWFLTGKTHTEDVYFCVKAQQFVGNVGVYMDTTIKVGHLLEKIVLTEDNRDILLKIHEKYKLNQLFLPDPTFVELLKASNFGNNIAIDEVLRPNPLEINEINDKDKSLVTGLKDNV